ncbi:MAG: protein kinase [Leptospiraceae bacterium]|nr:protein kinase [Leptospiraceae bacterium]MCP5501556.1 protein kinase [Leptospiraceae bacterium]
MIKCPKCSKDLNDGAKFCGYCGASMQKDQELDSTLYLLKNNLSGTYRVEKKIAEGGMAEIYVGEHLALEIKIIIKVLNDALSKQEEMRERFLFEARTGAKLKHRNIVNIIDVGMAEYRPYYVMEYLDLGSLKDLLEKEGPLEPQYAVNLVAQVLDGLSRAHENGVIHRDIKPENIMLREKFEPVILDFGIAKVKSSGIKTQTGMAIGTVSYMSPEQCVGEEIDGRSDIYSVGIMLYELLIGELPFKGDPVTVITQHSTKETPNIRKALLNLPKYQNEIFQNIQFEKFEQLEAIIKKATAKNKKNRFSKADEFAETLRSFLVEPEKKSNIPVTKYISLFGRKIPLKKQHIFAGYGVIAVIAIFSIFKIFFGGHKENVFISSEPDGANITINNEDTKKTTPAKFKLFPGGYTIILSKKDYHSERVFLRVKDSEKEITKEVKLLTEEEYKELQKKNRGKKPINPINDIMKDLKKMF